MKTYPEIEKMAALMAREREICYIAGLAVILGPVHAAEHVKDRPDLKEEVNKRLAEVGWMLIP